MRTSTPALGVVSLLLAACCCLVLLGSAAACGRQPAERDAAPPPSTAPAPGGAESTRPPTPAPPPVPAVYKTVENALTRAGLKVCSFTGYSENQDYAYLEARHYYVARDACRQDRPPVEGNARFGTVRVEIYLNDGTLKRGLATHEQETRYDRPVSGAAWTLERALVEVPHYVHPAMARVVDRALRVLPAKRRYFRFR